MGVRCGHLDAALRAREDRRVTDSLRCSECRRQADDGAKSWRAYETQEPDDSDAPGAIGVGVFCPECAEGEFGTDERTG
jgi:hypothetical protein